MTKSFPLATLITITTDCFVCNEFSDVYEILNFITGDNLFTHALPRAGRFAKPYILEAHPTLAISEEKMSEMDATSALPRDQARPFIDQWLKSLGLSESYDVESHSDAWLSINPMEELIGMVGKDKVIAVSTKE